METPLQYQSPLLQPPYRRSSPPLNRHSPQTLRQQQHQHQQQQQNGGFRLAMRHLTLQRISPNRKIVISKLILSLRNATTMSNQKVQIQPADVSKSTLNVMDSSKQEPEKSDEPVPPPPPEKPLPGDCCGSGCVRCVWDVYYEELEEYNNLYKSSKSEPTVNPKPS